MTPQEEKVLLAAKDYAAACRRFNAAVNKSAKPEERHRLFNAIVGKRRGLTLAAEALEPDAELNLPERPFRLAADEVPR